MFAHVVEGRIDDVRGTLPEAGQRLDDGTWRKLAGDPDEQARCGWLEVVDTPRPPDTEADTYVRDVLAVVDGHPRTTWKARPITDEERAAEAAEAEQGARARNLRQSIATLRGWAQTAEGHTVTPGNAVATVQATLGNLAKFYRGFADLLEHQLGADR